jgi:hypothetical protein
MHFVPLEPHVLRNLPGKYSRKISAAVRPDVRFSAIYASLVLFVCLSMLLHLHAQAAEAPAAGAADMASGTGNPYVDSYMPLDRPQVNLQPEPDAPRLFRGKDKDRDNNKMLVKGYDMLGFSSFDGKQVAPELALEQGKKLKADIVLVYSRESARTPKNVRAQQLRARAKADAASKSGQNTTAETQTTETVIEDDGATYNYYAAYWVKLAPPMIGVHVRKTAKDAPVQGLHVLAVVEESPAFVAGLQEKDVLLKIGDSRLQDSAALAAVARKYQGQQVEVEYQREGETRQTMLRVNLPAQSK